LRWVKNINKNLNKGIKFNIFQNILDVPRQLAGQAFRSNLFYFAKRQIKKVFPLQSLTQMIYDFRPACRTGRITILEF